MPRDFSRGRKVADLVQRELALLIQRQVKDPRLGMVTINEVEVSRDLAFADVYFTMLGSDDAASAEAALNQTSGFLRSQLAQSLKVRSAPKLRFHFDATVATGLRMDQAIDAALARDRASATARRRLEAPQ